MVLWSRGQEDAEFGSFDNELDELVSIAALGTGIAALVVSLGIPRPAGPMGLDGAIGPQGPEDPGALMVSKIVSRGAIPEDVIGTTCTSFPDANISITVSGLGRVVITSRVWIQLEHTIGQADLVHLFLGTSETDCALFPPWDSAWQLVSTEGSGPYQIAILVQGEFLVGTSGTFTFYLNARMFAGASPLDMLRTASMVAVFYPS